MAGEKKIEKSDTVATGLTSDPFVKLADQDGASGKDGIPSDSAFLTSSRDSINGMKGGSDQGSVGEQGAYYPPTSCYNYYYPGHNGSFPQLDDSGYLHADGSYPYAMQSDNGSLVYYLPGYDPYAAGPLVGVDGQFSGQQPYFSSSGYLLQHPVSYGSEAVPCYSWDSTYVGDAYSGTAADYEITKSGSDSTALAEKTNCNDASNFSKSVRRPNSIKPLNKEFHPSRKLSSFNNRRPSPFQHSGPMNYRTNGRIWNEADSLKLREKSNRTGDLESSTRGPRAHNRCAPLDSEVETEELGPTVSRDHYNVLDFQIEYENARFYVIKSYNEDDIHKSIKYDVWASTPNGNRKLDAAFQDAEMRASETGTKCPIFLFFSVNGSGQFVGLAEMIGQVDFKKDMDFWQLGKWNGFFPVKWHIVKDIPNTQLRHIILENNDSKPVTFSRDTQEIGLEQGMEMLKIFKNFTEKTSLLDDFIFYENREKFLHVKRSTKASTSKMELYESDDFLKHMNAGEKNIEEHSIGSTQISDPTTLINLTKNLSLNASPLKGNAVKNPKKN